MSIQEAEQIATKVFQGYQIDYIDDDANYYIVALKNVPMDGLHMIDKQTGNVMPYNPTLLKGKTK